MANRNLPASVYLVSTVLKSGAVHHEVCHSRREAENLCEVVPTACDPRIHEYRLVPLRKRRRSSLARSTRREGEGNG